MSTAMVERPPDLNPWPLTIASYNIHAAVGLDRAFAPERIARVVREIAADVVALQEVPLGDAHRPSVLTLLQQTTGYGAVEGPTYERADYRYGNAVLSWYPINAKRTVDLSFGS